LGATMAAIIMSEDKYSNHNNWIKPTTIGLQIAPKLRIATTILKMQYDTTVINS
jgi:hypothetical protein